MKAPFKKISLWSSIAVLSFALSACFDETGTQGPVLSSANTSSSSLQSSSSGQSQAYQVGCQYDGEVAWIVGSDYNTGILRAVNLQTNEECAINFPLWQDANVNTDGNSIFVIERFGSNKWMKIDPKSGKIVWYKTLPAKSNPYSVVFLDSTKAYINFYDAPYVVQVNPQNGAIVDSLNLSAFSADGNTTPNASAMLISQGKLIVALQRLNSAWIPQEAKLAIFDLSTHQLLDSLTLKTRNPHQLLQVDNQILVLNNGTDDGYPNYASQNDGAIESVHLATRTSEILFSESVLGGKPGHLEMTSNSQGYLSIYKNYGDQPVVSLNLSTKTIGLPLLGIKDSFGGLAWAPLQQKLVVNERIFTGSGVLVYSKDQLEKTFLSSELPPYHSVIVTHK